MGFGYPHISRIYYGFDTLSGNLWQGKNVRHVSLTMAHVPSCHLVVAFAGSRCGAAARVPPHGILSYAW